MKYDTDKNEIMNVTDYSSYFNEEETNWLAANQKVRKEIFLEIEDIANVNPLQNGEPDSMPLELAIQATKLTIYVARNKVLAGPYDSLHYNLIKQYFPQIKLSENLFWKYFSFECACKKSEGIKNKERIYLSALSGLILSNNLDDLSIDELSLGVYNMNTGKIEKIKGIGVNSRL